MANIKKKLIEWAHSELISTEQMEKILTYETKDKHNWILYGFLVLGVAVIGIGIVSLIAANWDIIPPSVKLMNNLIFLVASAFVIYFVLDRSKNEILLDVGITLFAILAIASIGLISQVFHTGGELYMALIFWMVIITPLALLSRRTFLPHLWVAILVFVVFSLLFEKAGFINEQFVIVFLPFISFLLGEISSKFQGLKPFTQVFRIWIYLSALYVIGMIDFSISMHYHYYRYESITGVGAMAYISVLLLSLAVLYFATDMGRRLKFILTLMSVLTLLYYLSFSYWQLFTGHYQGGIYFILMFLMLSLIFIIIDNRFLFNISTLLVGFRFLILYIQVVGSLAITGVGLIISGIIIIVFTVLWYKNRDRLANLAEKLVR